MKCSLHSLPALSVVIPAYNESQRLPPFLERTVSFLDSRASPYEILVVDDGSRDNTAQMVELFAASNPSVRLIRSACNMGKGAAVRRGIQAAQGGLQLFADADGATPIEELEGLEHAIETGADLAIGSRALASRSSTYTVKARWHRSALGMIFNAVVYSDSRASMALTRTRSVALNFFERQRRKISFRSPPSTGMDWTWSCSISRNAVAIALPKSR